MGNDPSRRETTQSFVINDFDRCNKLILLMLDYSRILFLPFLSRYTHQVKHIQFYNMPIHLIYIKAWLVSSLRMKKSF